MPIEMSGGGGAKLVEGCLKVLMPFDQIFKHSEIQVFDNSSRIVKCDKKDAWLSAIGHYNGIEKQNITQLHSQCLLRLLGTLCVNWNLETAKCRESQQNAIFKGFAHQSSSIDSHGVATNVIYACARYEIMVVFHLFIKIKLPTFLIGSGNGIFIAL